MKHILIVDSDPSAAHVTWAGVKRTIPEASLVVEPDAERGLLSMERQRPDVLIIDPSTHNGAAVRLIRELKAGTHMGHVMVLASAPSPTLERDMQRLGVDLYLQKPSPIAPMLEALRAIFDGLQTFDSA